MTAGLPTAAVQADRCAGTVLAAAAGDALGAGYEFGPPLSADTAVEMKGGGAFQFAPGEWTDDTQMSAAVLTPLAAGNTSLELIESGFRAWFDSGPADVGSQTRGVLSKPGPLIEAAASYQASDRDAAGNGSLMRTGPVALAHLGDRPAIASLAADVSALTHPHADCQDACVLWSLAVDTAIRTAPPDAPFDWVHAVRQGLDLVPDDRQARWSDLIDEAVADPPIAFENNGWVVHAFQAALSAIVHTPVPDREPCRHLQHSLETAVRCGGDTDTVAAIAGSLLGARWGATAIPLSWRRVLHGRRTYREPPLRVADVDAMARLAARGGKPDSQGWPGVERLIPYYTVNYGDTPLRAELAHVMFGNAAALGAALDDDVEVVYSLCRMGTADVPSDRDHHVIGLLDTDRDDNPNLAFVLSDLADALERDVAAGRFSFVHCVAAQNRTPAVAAA